MKDLIDLSISPNESQDFDTYLNQVCDTLCLEYASYAAVNPINGSAHVFTTYPEVWKKHYVANRLHHIDPTLQTAVRSIAPVDWQRLERDVQFAQVFSQAHDFGLPDVGMTIPVRGPYGETGMFSVSSSMAIADWNKLIPNIIANLQSFAVHMHDTVMNSDTHMQALRYPSLSTREIQVLQWTAVGKSYQDIGDILSISHRTVEVHLRSGREKLCAITTVQAVGRAISLGMILPG